jgi:competence protein ComEC
MTAVGVGSPRDAVDLRLAMGAAAAWLAVLWAVDRGPGPTMIVAGIAVGAAVLLLIGGRRWSGAAALALVLFCIALVLLPLAGRIAHARASPLTVLAREHAPVTATLTVTADPRTLAAKGVAGSPRVAVETSADAVLVRGRSTPVDGTVLVLGDAGPWRDVLPGQRVRIDGSLQPDLGGGNLSVTLFARTRPTLLGDPPWWQRAAGRIRSSLQTAASGLPDQERGLLPGLIDGDTTNLDPVLADRFRSAGLTHLVAVSGTNCSIVVGAVLLVLRRARARPWVCAVAGGLVLLMFVIVARPSPSVLRAALMAVIALVSLGTGRPRAALPAVSAAVLALLIWDPPLAGSASFAMSVLATVALLLIAPGWARALRERGVPLGVAESVAVAAAAHLVTAPIVAAISGRLSLVAIPANVLAEPVVALITVVGFAAAVLAPLWLGGGAALAWVAGWPCRWLVAVADYFGGLHGATVPWPGGRTGGILLLLTVAALAVASVRTGARRALVAAAATALVIFIPVRAVTSAWPVPGWIFAACDVGQGDALVLSTGPGEAVVIDAGPDPVLIDRCLRDLGVHRIPLLVLTHFHLDHVGGLPGVARGRPIERILTSPLDGPQSGSLIVHRIAAAMGRPVLAPPAGTSLDVGRVHLDVLGPVASFHGTRSDPNNSSLVLRADVGGVRILLPGDAEVEAQRSLVAAGADLRADVLKVPHHGSAYSDPTFLAAAHASLAIISVGAHNDYGHPSPVLLTEMARLGVPVFRTDRQGDVAVVGSVGHLTAVAHGTVASTVGERSRTPCPIPPSAAGARMAACRRVRSASTTFPIRFRACSSSSVTRNCSSTGRSARSPPPPVGPTRRSPRPNWPAASWRDPNCTRCSARRCSARLDCWSSAPPRTCGRRRPPCSGRISPRRPTAPSSCCTTSAARRARRCSRPPVRRRRWRSAAPSSLGPTSARSSSAPRFAATAGGSRPMRSPRSWTPSAVICASSPPSPASWSVTRVVRSGSMSSGPTTAAGPRSVASPSPISPLSAAAGRRSRRCGSRCRSGCRMW